MLKNGDPWLQWALCSNLLYLCHQTLLASAATCLLSRGQLERKLEYVLFLVHTQLLFLQVEKRISNKIHFMLSVPSLQVTLQLKQQLHQEHLCLLGAPVVFAADTSIMDNVTLTAELIMWRRRVNVPFCLESNGSLAGHKPNLIMWDLTSQWYSLVSDPAVTSLCAACFPPS